MLKITSTEYKGHCLMHMPNGATLVRDGLDPFTSKLVHQATTSDAARNWINARRVYCFGSTLALRHDLTTRIHGTLPAGMTGRITHVATRETMEDDGAVQVEVETEYGTTLKIYHDFNHDADVRLSHFNVLEF